ncbi:hypothetical protein BDZ89DRAFT_1121659 [Hymenopellis radicata]|nr:hypothetical protein BDZ89DRAFT_1121659 [Hymenopellis radicata]
MLSTLSRPGVNSTASSLQLEIAKDASGHLSALWLITVTVINSGSLWPTDSFLMQERATPSPPPSRPDPAPTADTRPGPAQWPRADETFFPHNRGFTLPNRPPKPTPVPKQVPSNEAVKTGIDNLQHILHPRRNKGRGYQVPKLNIVLRARLEMMIQFLRLYKASGYTGWTMHSNMIAVAGGKGQWLARKLREWSIDFCADKKNVPTAMYGRINSSILSDEDVAGDIHLHLQSLGKFVSAKAIVRFVATPEFQARLRVKRNITLRTAQRWMKKMGLQMAERAKRDVLGCHERDDVVDYRQNVFLPRWRALEARTRWWNTTASREYIDLEAGMRAYLSSAQDARIVVIWRHDESTFYANDRRNLRWVHESEKVSIKPKGEGASQMAGDFVSPDYGWLQSKRLDENGRVGKMVEEVREVVMGNGGGGGGGCGVDTSSHIIRPLTSSSSSCCILLLLLLIAVHLGRRGSPSSIEYCPLAGAYASRPRFHEDDVKSVSIYMDADLESSASVVVADLKSSDGSRPQDLLLAQSQQQQARHRARAKSTPHRLPDNRQSSESDNRHSLGSRGGRGGGSEERNNTRSDADASLRDSARIAGSGRIIVHVSFSRRCGPFALQKIHPCSDSRATRAMDILDADYPDEKHVFAYDNATIHTARAPDALSALKMPAKPSSNFNKVKDSEGVATCIHMRDGTFRDGTPQSLYLPDGRFKGSKILIQERRAKGHDLPDPADLRAQCGKNFTCRRNSDTRCCCKKIMYCEPDFQNQKSMLEEHCAARGYEVIFFPKYHPELNFIEQCWGYAKRIYRMFPESSKESDLTDNLLLALKSVPLESMRRFADAYFRGLNGADAAWANRRYRGHRTLPPSYLDDLKYSAKMPSLNTSLPLELLDMIIQHLSSDTYALRNCALVSRTWSCFSQRALFSNAQVDLHTYKKMVELLDDLVSVPHLQTLIREVKIYQFVRWRCAGAFDDIPFPVYMSCLTSVLPLLPNLAKVVFHELSWPENDSNLGYLDLIPDVLGSAPLVELDVGGIYSIENLWHVFDVLEGTNIKRVSLSGKRPTTSDLSASHTFQRMHLPSLECIRCRLGNLRNEFYDCLTRRVHLPNLKQCEIITDHVDDLNAWPDLLLRGFPPLELFKLEVDYAEGTPDDIEFTGALEADAYCPIPLAGLPFQHVHLCVNPNNLNEARKFIEWWSSTFRALSDSKATIHFTELTFTFPDFQDIYTLEEAWNSLDDSLAHTTFSGVQNIHFETWSWRGVRARFMAESITEAAYPDLADTIRLALPRLASQGVLSLV